MCKVCDDEEIGNEIVVASAEGPYFQDRTAFLDMALFRSDRWSAELHAWTTVGGREPAPLLTATVQINYCPWCGRRLSLADASRRESSNETD
jgi:hypothetical protein